MWSYVAIYTIYLLFNFLHSISNSTFLPFYTLTRPPTLSQFHTQTHTSTEVLSPSPCCSWLILSVSGSPGTCQKVRPSACPHGCGMTSVSQLTCPRATHSHTHKPELLNCFCKVICPYFSLSASSENSLDMIILEIGKWGEEMVGVKKQRGKKNAQGNMRKSKGVVKGDALQTYLRKNGWTWKKSSRSKGWTMVLTLTN